MPKRKKPAVRRARRSPYERSLEYASNRLEKALTEQMHHQACLETLSQEIPFLQNVIRSLTPPDAKLDGKQLYGLIDSNMIEKIKPKHIPVDQSEFLSRFVKPIKVADIAADQDEPFIPDNVPGTEVLP